MSLIAQPELLTLGLLLLGPLALLCQLLSVVQMHQVYSSRCSGISSSSSSKFFSFRSINNLWLQLPLVVKPQQLAMEVLIPIIFHHHRPWPPSSLMHFLPSLKILFKTAVALLNHPSGKIP
uniref:Secreted protein n=1 Tax=Populus davidiana TaxID=266767 RepID=A0A6M2EK47_9ROSI